MKLEADRMVNLVLSQEEFAKEIRVVMEERRWRTDDRPRALVYEQLLAAALKAHPYRNPIIGWMDDLENMRVEDARAFYQRWYAPNNATLVVVGDVSPGGSVQARAAIFRVDSAQDAAGAQVSREEPEQLGPQQLTVKAPASCLTC